MDALAREGLVLPVPVTTDSHSAPSAEAAAADDLYTSHAPLLRYIALTKFSVPREDVDPLVHDVFATYFSSARRSTRINGSSSGPSRKEFTNSFHPGG